MALATQAPQSNAMPLPPTTSLTDKTICLSLSFSAIGNNRKVSNSEITVDADADMIHVSKQLLDSPELKAVFQHRREISSRLLKVALPSLFRTGVYLIPLPVVEGIEKMLTEGQQKDEVLVEKFLHVYEAAKTDAQERLKSLYNPNDYPSLKRVQGAFAFNWQWITFSTPGKLKEISQHFFEQEQAKAAQHWAEATSQVTLLLRTQLKTLVDHMVERLTPDADGKLKKFQASSVKNIQEFLGMFSIKNVTDDTQLEQIVKAANNLLDGVSPEELQTGKNANEAVRDAVGKGLNILKKHLDNLVVEAGNRKITFEAE